MRNNWWVRGRHGWQSALLTGKVPNGIDSGLLYGNIRLVDALRAYLATLKPADQAAYALRCGTTIGYLRKAICTRPRLDGALARRLDEESSGAVPKESLRPDVFDGPPSEEAI